MQEQISFKFAPMGLAHGSSQYGAEVELRKDIVDLISTRRENSYKILPITKMIIETDSFDIQKIKNPEIQGEEYQQGEQLHFWNVREYVLFRDHHSCQCCKGKSKDIIFNVHHIESRKTGGDAPNNLITLCETCHNGYHKGIVTLPKNIHRGMSFRDARCISGNPTAIPFGHYFYQKRFVVIIGKYIKQTF